MRDFFAFEEHVAAGLRLRGAEVPEAWYEEPVFYFSNPASIRGPGDEVPAADSSMLDFELEIAAVIGQDNEIAGFTLMNDWSARDLQMKEMTVGLGRRRARTSPPEHRADARHARRAALRGRAPAARGDRLGNAEEVTRSERVQAALHLAGDRRAGRARHALRPGDVFGSGTLGRGCLLELGPLEGDRWLEPGDLVALEGGPLGRLENPGRGG